MIGTVQTKRQQLERGYFRIGNGPEKVLLIGSCRSVPYLNYFDLWISRHGRFTVSFIDPCNFNWNLNDDRVDYEAAINSKETDATTLNLLAETDIYIHEWYQNYGMFNSSHDSPKNIFQFGLKPKVEICIPNFNDYHVLGQPKEYGLEQLEKFYANVRRSSFPEFEQHFKDTWTTTRYFWSGNHITKEFTLFIFRLMNSKFLNLGYDEGFWKEIEGMDMYAGNPMAVTQQDRDNHGITW